MTNQVYIYILFGSLLIISLGFIVTKHFKIISTSSLSILSVPDEGYSSNMMRILNLISTFYCVICFTLMSVYLYIFTYFPEIQQHLGYFDCYKSYLLKCRPIISNLIVYI